MAYTQTEGDEVEDLAALLAYAQQRFPVRASFQPAMLCTQASALLLQSYARERVCCCGSPQHSLQLPNQRAGRPSQQAAESAGVCNIRV